MNIGQFVQEFVTLIKKPILATLLSLMLVSVFAFASIGNVYAAALPHKEVQVAGTSPSTVRPNASGGGCGGWVRSNQGGFVVKACISYSWPSVIPDGYYNYHPVKAVKNCTIIIWLHIFDGTEAVHVVDCQIGNNIHADFGGGWDDYFSGRRYQTSIEVYILYTNGSTDQQTAWSPAQYT